MNLLITYYLLLITYLSIYFLLTLYKTEWGIYLIVLTLPSYLIRFNLGPLPTTLLELQILILFLIWLIKTIKNKTIKQSLLPITYYLLPIALFLIAATISIFISTNLRAALGLWKAYFIEPILFLIVFINAIDKPKLAKVFLFLCFNVLMLSCFALYQKLTGAFISNPFWALESTRRVTSIFPYPNALALFLIPLITILIGLFPILFKNLNLKNYLKITKLKIKNFLLFTSYFLLLTSSILAIYFTKSKGALIALLVGLIFYAIFYKPYREYFIIFLFILLTTLLPYYLTTQSIRGQPTVVGGDSISTRLDAWNETLTMLKTQLIFGAGLSGYQTAVAPFHQKQYIEIYLYPHNIFLNFWTETGLLGLAAFIWIIILFYKNGFKQPQSKIFNLPAGKAGLKSKIINLTTTNCQLPITAAMTALLVHGLVDVPYFKNDLSVLFWLLIGSSIIVTQQNNPAQIN